MNIAHTFKAENRYIRDNAALLQQYPSKSCYIVRNDGTKTKITVDMIKSAYHELLALCR